MKQEIKQYKKIFKESEKLIKGINHENKNFHDYKIVSTANNGWINNSKLVIDYIKADNSLFKHIRNLNYDNGMQWILNYFRIDAQSANEVYKSLCPNNYKKHRNKLGLPLDD